MKLVHGHWDNLGYYLRKVLKVERINSSVLDLMNPIPPDIRWTKQDGNYQAEKALAEIVESFSGNAPWIMYEDLTNHWNVMPVETKTFIDNIIKSVEAGGTFNAWEKHKKSGGSITNFNLRAAARDEFEQNFPGFSLKAYEDVPKLVEELVAFLKQLDIGENHIT